MSRRQLERSVERVNLQKHGPIPYLLMRIVERLFRITTGAAWSGFSPHSVDRTPIGGLSGGSVDMELLDMAFNKLTFVNCMELLGSAHRSGKLGLASSRARGILEMLISQIILNCC